MYEARIIYREKLNPNSPHQALGHGQKSTVGPCDSRDEASRLARAVVDSMAAAGAMVTDVDIYQTE